MKCNWTFVFADLGWNNSVRFCDDGKIDLVDIACG